jgi:bifunctional non-homologous end joining protein LigD
MAKQTLPEWLEPMAATLTQERFTGPQWTFERKLDGIRLLAYKDDGSVTLMSRNRLPQNHAYPSVVEAIRTLPVHDAILDGEALGVWNRQGDVEYHVFDVLWLDGRNVCSLPLIERRDLLAKLQFNEPMKRVPEVLGDAPWDRACSEGWEGVIAKLRDAPYEHKRSKAWLKMKCEASQELVVGGFTDPQRSRVGLGALLVGYFDGEDFIYAGKVGTGFDNKLLLELRARLDKIETPKPPFTRAIGLPNIRAHWTRPEVVVQVAFMEWTKYDKMRHPRLLGLRIDKAARDVIREMPS